MELMKKPSFVTTLMFGSFLLSSLHLAEAQIGACYGRNGNNLPAEQDVVNLFRSKGIARMRLYDPDQKALPALRGTSIGLILDVPRNSLNCFPQLLRLPVVGCRPTSFPTLQMSTFGTLQ
ncbi:hypothetical protein RND81_12G179400 [Saponaria officinalis]|uniref:Glucan endo-1,3-beta-D-glucosidase n=1 Tax=Saponaria officinalis TaxID=3572 RepID=A0AAW1HC67_SAPOF